MKPLLKVEVRLGVNACQVFEKLLMRRRVLRMSGGSEYKVVIKVKAIMVPDRKLPDRWDDVKIV